jgi:hypothetical protein
LRHQVGVRIVHGLVKVVHWQWWIVI